MPHGIPGDIGTATIAGHVNDPLGRPEIFANLEDLQPGDLIIVHLKNTTMDIRFTVDQIEVYTSVLIAPGLVINEKLVYDLWIPSKEQVIGWLREAIHEQLVAG